MAKAKAALAPGEPHETRSSVHRRVAVEGTPHLRPGLSFPVVAIGASAGGLAAFTELLKALPSKTGMAFVLIQHLEPKHESALTSLLSKATSMPVVEVSEGMDVEPNCVYVIPPNKVMTIREGILRLTPRSAGAGLQRPIDDFFMALAEEQGEAAIGVVLSGAGSDGTYGLKAIKAAGGVTSAQDPKTAQWSAMPMGAITAGGVDFVLSPKRIAKELARIVRNPYLAEARDMPEGSELDKVCLILRSAVGIDFRLYKQATVRRRIARRMALQRIVSLNKYAQILKRNGEEAQALADDIFIHVTSFFRDPECFQALRKKVLAKLGPKKTAEDPIRIWVAGCSSGEEVYSIAMLLLEELGERANRIKLQIFGTDIQESAVERARAGIYSEAAVAGVSAARLKRFFVKLDHGYQVLKAIRDLCVFARHDLAKDPPFSRLNLISCRNVLIYMGPALQKRVYSAFQYALKAGGFLFLGNSESSGDYSDAFSAEDQKHRIFSRKLAAPVFHDFRSAMDFPRAPNATLVRTAVASMGRDFRKEAEGVLLEQYAPPALIVDPDLQIVHFQGNVNTYLAPAPGQPSFHLLKMVRPEFVVDLRTAIHKARREGVTVHKDDLQFMHEGQPAAVRLEVQPLRRRNGRKQDLLVVFQKIKPAGREEEQKPDRAAGKRHAPEKIARLERELISARQHLRALIAEHETAEEEMKVANEEVLSSNEELQSTNEELETAKEELQSANEELVTLNDEMQQRNDELSVLTQDLNNLLVGLNIPVLVLDGDLHVRRFTPVAGALLNLIPGDVGRPFSDIASPLDVADWAALFAEVTGRGQIVEREVSARNGNRYSMRMRPYKTKDNKIEGVLVVMLDTDLIYRARDEAQKSGDYSRAIVETIHDALVVVDSEFRVLSVNQSFCRLFRVPLAGRKGQAFFGPGPAQCDTPQLQSILQDVLAKNGAVKDFEIDQDFPVVGRRTLVFNARQIDTSGRILIAIEDITERKQAQEKELHILRAFVEQAPFAVIMLDRHMRGIQVSQRWLEDMSMTRECVLGKSHYECFPNMPAHWKELHRRSLAGELLSGHEESYVRPDGSEQCVNWRMVPWGDSGESPGGILISYEDVTQRKHAEEEARQSAATIRSLIESAPQSVVGVSADGTIVLANGNVEKMFGYRREELLGQQLAILLPESVRAAHVEHRNSYFDDMQSRSMGIGLCFEARRKDGTIFPAEIGLSTIDTATGKLGVAFVADITERKRLEEAAEAHTQQVQALAARLLTAQEDERRRVSRELHDQICQQLASLAIDVGGLAANPPSREGAPKLLKVLQRRIVKASEEARHIAYELHPSMLDDLGLATALRALCKEFSAQHLDMELRFSGEDKPMSVPREVASCVFRVALESLQNIAKHSKAKHVSVALAAEKGSVALTIADDGAGFDLKAVQGRGGLGLIGMQERVRLLNGKVTITARPGHGARIALVIPVLESSR